MVLLLSGCKGGGDVVVEWVQGWGCGVGPEGSRLAARSASSELKGGVVVVVFEEGMGLVVVVSGC